MKLLYSCQGTVLFRPLHKHTTCLPEIRFMPRILPDFTFHKITVSKIYGYITNTFTFFVSSFVFLQLNKTLRFQFLKRKYISSLFEMPVLIIIHSESERDIQIWKSYETWMNASKKATIHLQVISWEWYSTITLDKFDKWVLTWWKHLLEQWGDQAE